MRELIRIIFYCLIDSFCLNPVKLSDIAVQQDTLAAQLNNQTLSLLSQR